MHALEKEPKQAEKISKNVYKRITSLTYSLTFSKNPTIYEKIHKNFIEEEYNIIDHKVYISPFSVIIDEKNPIVGSFFM